MGDRYLEMRHSLDTMAAEHDLEKAALLTRLGLLENMSQNGGQL